MNILSKSPDRKCALIIVDVQPSFLNERNSYIVTNIISYLDAVSYDIYVETTFHAEKDSLWERQQDWICPQGQETKTVPILAEKLRRFNPIRVVKETKSAFKGDVNLVELFKQQGISEVHVVGLDTNDCILATAYESFDLGFLTYVIEDCCESAASEELHQAGLQILRWQDMTK